MKPSTCLVLTLVLGAGLYSASALAQDTAVAAAAQSGPAPDAALTAAQTSKPHHRAHHVRARHHGGNRYNQCLKEKLAVAQHYCDSHADACQAEKDGAAKQCLKEKLAVAQHYCDSHADASCQAEKDGAAKQCRSEARGEKQTG